MFSFHLIHIIIPTLHVVYDLYLKKTLLLMSPSRIKSDQVLPL